MGGVLEDAPLAIVALAGMLDEILTNRSEVLLVQPLLPLKFLFSVRKPTTLILLLVFAGLPSEPVLAKFGLDLFLPLAFLASR